jgi:cytochrome c556
MGYPQVQIGSLDVQLQQMLLEARRYPSGHFRRQQALTRMIRLIAQSKKLWQKNAPYYADALQQTWLYFCQNICEATTAECYDSARGSIITGLAIASVGSDCKTCMSKSASSRSGQFLPGVKGNILGT